MLYTHMIYSKEEPLWLYDYSPRFDIGNHAGVHLANELNKLQPLMNAAGVDPLKPAYETKVFVYDEDFEMFESTCIMRGIRYRRL